MDEFKQFLKTIPSIKQDVLNGRYTWHAIPDFCNIWKR